MNPLGVGRYASACFSSKPVETSRWKRRATMLRPLYRCSISPRWSDLPRDNSNHCTEMLVVATVNRYSSHRKAYAATTAADINETRRPATVRQDRSRQVDEAPHQLHGLPRVSDSEEDDHLEESRDDASPPRELKASCALLEEVQPLEPGQPALRLFRSEPRQFA